MKTKLLFFFFLISTTNPGYPSTFIGYFEDAARTDNDYLLTLEKIKADNVDFDVSRSRLLPSINAQLNSYKVDQTRRDGTVRQDQSYDSQSNSIQITAPVYSPRLYRDAQHQEELTHVRELEAQAAKQSLLLKFIEKYFSLHIESHSVDRYENKTKVYSSYYNNGRALQLNGRISEQERDERKKLLLNSKSELLGASQKFTSARRDLVRVIGKSPEKLTKYVIDDNLLVFVKKYILELNRTPPDSAGSDNLRIQIKRRELAAARLQLNAISGLHYPDVNFFGQAAASKGESSYFTTTQTSAFYFGLQVVIPLYSGGGITDRHRQQLYRIRAAEIELEREMKNVSESLSNLGTRLSFLLDSYALMTENFKLIQRKVQRLENAISQDNKSFDELSPTKIEYFELLYHLRTVKIDILRQYVNLEVTRGVPVDEIIRRVDAFMVEKPTDAG